MARWRGGVSQLSGLCFGEELFEASYLEGGSVARVSGQHKKPTSRIEDTRRFWRGWRSRQTHCTWPPGAAVTTWEGLLWAFLLGPLDPTD